MNLKLIFCYTCFLINVLHVASSFSSPVFTKEKFREVATQLISNCDPSACYSTDVAQIITQGSSSQHDQIIHILNEKGTLCLRFALEAVKKQLDQYNKLPSSCESLIGEDKRNCENTQNEYTAVSKRVLSLANLIVSQQTSLTEPFALHLENKTPSPYMNTGLLNTLQGLEDQQSCSDYKIGEERQFIITPFRSMAYYYSYRIKRESEKHYKAFVVVEFSPHSSYHDGFPVPKDQVHDYFMAQVGFCVQKANSKMKGPNGETLEIVIEDARQIDSCMPKYIIQAGAITGRHTASSNYYYVAMNCALKVHEIMHLLGLSDEYKNPTQNIHSPNYDCRAPQDNSILENHERRWNNVFNNSINSSLLDPSHFQAILYGNCSLRNDVNLYRQCSRLSYQTSANNEACLEKKAYCESQNILGRDKVAEQQRINLEIQSLQAELESIEPKLQRITKFSETNPNQNRISRRNTLLDQKQKAKQNIADLERVLDLVSAWPTD